MEKTPTIALHLLQNLNPTLLLSRIVVEHSLNKVSGHKNLFGKNIQQFVIYGKVSLYSKFGHFLQSSVDELHMATPSYVPLSEDINHLVKCGLGSGLFGHLLEQILLGDQGLGLLRVIVINKPYRFRLTLSRRWAATKLPQHLQMLYIRKKPSY